MTLSEPNPMNLPPLTYLSIDGITSGVGQSQVLPYVVALARRGMIITLHTLETDKPKPELTYRLREAGIDWHAHPFGRAGAISGVTRMLRGMAYLRNADLVHARSDIPAGSALLARSPSWVWDMRGLWTEERMELGLLRAGSLLHRLMSRIEKDAACNANGIVTLSATAIDVLAKRYGSHVRTKARVIPTCVDLDKFSLTPMPPVEPVRLLLAGTLNRRYDVPLTLDLLRVLRRRRSSEIVALVPRVSPWDSTLREAGIDSRSADRDDMPSEVSSSHFGLSILRRGRGLAMMASMPTKLGEFLAAGRPVIVNRGLGDMDRLLEDFDCGIVVDGSTSSELERAADEIERLLADAETPVRCRALATAHFNLQSGVDSLIELYTYVSDPISAA